MNILTLKTLTRDALIIWLGGSDSKESACNARDPGLILSRRDWLPSILAQRILWIEEPGRLQSMGVAKTQLTLSLLKTLRNRSLGFF